MFIEEKHYWAKTNLEGNTREIFSLQYSLSADSAVYPNLPINFLGNQVKEIDHHNVYEFIKTLFVEMDEDDISVNASLLKENEFIKVTRTTFDGIGMERERFDYIVTQNTTSCHEQTWNSEGSWSMEQRTEGTEAFAACDAFINDFSP